MNKYKEAIATLTDVFADNVEFAEAEALLDSYFEKYKWHDLRNNPNDLPKLDYADCVCLIMYEDGSKEYYAYYWDECKFSGLTTDIKVLAWKYIEPVEGEQL